ncbi:MAG: hypothetical protein PHE59_00140 [Patescibacteria group bacterium]|nr:hypothetical protein [Patescibacteria group bacterium]MDD5164580.1 hypothetical protein [Patescibacteria group bacterium]MDD5534335.1 hypothetical protein [Patescibacteria group bacterium]
MLKWNDKLEKVLGVWILFMLLLGGGFWGICAMNCGFSSNGLFKDFVIFLFKGVVIFLIDAVVIVFVPVIIIWLIWIPTNSVKKIKDS